MVLQWRWSTTQLHVYWILKKYKLRQHILERLSTKSLFSQHKSFLISPSYNSHIWISFPKRVNSKISKTFYTQSKNFKIQCFFPSTVETKSYSSNIKSEWHDRCMKIPDSITITHRKYLRHTTTQNDIQDKRQHQLY